MREGLPKLRFVMRFDAADKLILVDIGVGRAIASPNNDFVVANVVREAMPQDGGVEEILAFQ